MKEEAIVKLELNAAGIRRKPTVSAYDTENRDKYVKNKQVVMGEPSKNTTSEFMGSGGQASVPQISVIKQLEKKGSLPPTNVTSIGQIIPF